MTITMQKTRVTLTSEDLRTALYQYTSGRENKMADLKLVPVPTRILTNKDNIVDAIMEYAGHDITNHDIVCVAESVVAITQGRYIRPEELHICWQARLMNRFVPGAGSMASIYGMQAAMEEEGKWNMLFLS